MKSPHDSNPTPQRTSQEEMQITERENRNREKHEVVACCTNLRCRQIEFIAEIRCQERESLKFCNWFLINKMFSQFVCYRMELEEEKIEFLGKYGETHKLCMSHVAAFPHLLCTIVHFKNSCKLSPHEFVITHNFSTRERWHMEKVCLLMKF